MTAAKLHVVNLLPTYNEAENIIPMLETLEKIAKQHPQYQWSTLVVDDNSPDGTGTQVEKYLKKHPHVHLLTGSKQGLGEALIRGYQHAIKKLKADIIVSNDCDFQFDPHDIPKLLSQIDQGFDVVIASRHVQGGGVQGWPVGRRITHFIANTIFATYVAGNTEVSDHQGDFRAMRVKGVLDRINFDRIPVTGYGFLNYMIYEFSKTKAKFTEVPVTFKWREKGETKVSFSPKYFKTFFRDTIEYIKLCLLIRWQKLNNRV